MDVHLQSHHSLNVTSLEYYQHCWYYMIHLVPDLVCLPSLLLLVVGHTLSSSLAMVMYSCNSTTISMCSNVFAISMAVLPFCGGEAKEYGMMEFQHTRFVQWPHNNLVCRQLQCIDDYQCALQVSNCHLILNGSIEFWRAE